MTVATHVLAGMVIEQYFVRLGMIPPSTFSLTTGILAATIPDIDTMLSLRHFWDHRKSSLLHVPLFWATIFISGSIASFVTGNMDLMPYLWLAGASLLSHFILDSVGQFDGIRWLAPFDTRIMSVVRQQKPPAHWQQRLAGKLRHPATYAECGLIVLSLLWLTR
jgi:hypothetical protein